LSAQTIDLLRGRLRALGDTVFRSSLPTQALHGDASLSNLLRTPERLVWNDFEDTFRGPVHWDVAGYVMSLRARGADSSFIARVLDAYGWLDERELAPFTEAHHLYDQLWGSYVGPKPRRT
jgi:Ser/Thr protein kinase RdoA (MazF antagonist)